MKDRQVQFEGTQPGIPVISPLLHWLAMPVIVFLRSGFGFSFLRPKSVFLAFAFASTLFFIFAWLEQGVWPNYWAVALYSSGASLLYIIHLIIAFGRETRKQGKHDFHSGTSHLLRLPGLNLNRGNGSLETFVQLWIEPVIAIVVAALLRGFMAEQRLSTWLMIVAVAMWLKAFLNYWYALRSEKKHGDIIEDAEEKMPDATGHTDMPLPNAGGRKPRAKYAPSTQANENEQRFAEVLRLMPPYTLEQAEQNYRKLMKACHPDSSPSSNDNVARLALLSEAIAFFRGESMT